MHKCADSVEKQPDIGGETQLKAMKQVVERRAFLERLPQVMIHSIMKSPVLDVQDVANLRNTAMSMNRIPDPY